MAAFLDSQLDFINQVAKVTCSFGVAEYVPVESADDLTARADAALYRAKLNGRNCVELAPMPEG
ncbi:MAG TPA: diguanylate cyclase [Methyloceanibacter sp.]|nr:diguanylate cyclase [Methyloceanibacter sp.]